MSGGLSDGERSNNGTSLPEPVNVEVLRASVMRLMEEWDDLVSFVEHFPRKYLPRQALLEKLRSLRPF